MDFSASEIGFVVVAAVAGGTVAAGGGIVEQLVSAVGAVFVVLLNVLRGAVCLVLIVLLYVNGLIVLATVLSVVFCVVLYVVHVRYTPFFGVSMLAYGRFMRNFLKLFYGYQLVVA